MPSIWTMGELLVEIMRPQPGLGLYNPGPFLGPYPSGAPAIFIDTVARLGHPAGMIGGVGEDDFGRGLIDRLHTRRRALRAHPFLPWTCDGSRLCQLF